MGCGAMVPWTGKRSRGQVTQQDQLRKIWSRLASVRRGVWLKHAASISEICVATTEKNRRSPIRVVEHLQADQSHFQVGCRAFDHDVNLNTATKGVAVEIVRHRSW